MKMILLALAIMGGVSAIGAPAHAATYCEVYPGSYLCR